VEEEWEWNRRQWYTWKKAAKARKREGESKREAKRVEREGRKSK